MSDRGKPYPGLVNMSRSERQPDDWRVAVIDPSDVPVGYDPAFLRGLCFAIPLGALPWLAAYLLYRVIAA